ncbi:hypothetical protein F0562_028255 [Nyssa sinensis]|uniref:nitrate reductase (NADH) n=1 Tax=Nyssa sinensis TaxID=561372 RepID=A0A5J5BBF6_9ASTE|nr:hypothetical protein F0562_028255 [Nyssa sinensis]
MAASVENRQFSRLELASKSVLNHRSDLPALGFNFLPTTEQTRPKKPIVVEDSSSDDDDDEENDYKDTIKKENSELEPSVLDSRDEGTADNWIERNPSMIRLTGKHPFNSEPPLARLMHHGFITPVPLHYVRNHGPVPKANWENWTVEVCGLVKRPGRFTMDQLANEFPCREFPVSLVCAGNRRKEQNMVKQTIGFNWGAAGVSTSVWRGVPLRHILKKCGIFSSRKGALNVCFEGAEDLPGGGGSKYGTSIKREIAMDPSRDIILAYMQNGERLSPDHGFPVRMIIPGFIGGRMVKWLKGIMVTTQESDSYYHYRDNRVLPTQVDAELANAEAWWYKPNYTINELNINSVITTPCHEEILPINTWITQRPYTLKGYAYSGGGKKVTRVEVTIDNGETWHVCTVDYPEKPNRYGKYWCWCFWSLEVEVLELLGAKEMAVRAWDETHNTQPEKLIWNLMGMMNNCWFRIKMNVCKPHKGVIGIVFEHPTQPGNQSGGWMARERKLENSSEANQTMKKNISSPLINTSSKTFSMSETIPAAPTAFSSMPGTDCTEEFDAIHSDKAKKLLEDYRIGELITTGYTSDSTTSSPNNSVHGALNATHLAPITEVEPARRVALVPREKIPCKLVSKKSISHDVRLFRVSLPSQDQILGLPVGKHGMNPKFPNGGLMSQYLESLPLGSVLDVKGPLGHIEYTGKGNFIVHGKHKFAKRLAMVAGGTGITPIYQVLQAILKDPDDDTEMYLIYANRTEDDILLRDELDGWAEKYNERLKVWYVVGKTIREGWKYSVGHLTENILREHIPEPSDDTLALACGPPAMVKFAVQRNLEKMGYDIKNSLLVF